MLPKSTSIISFVPTNLFYSLFIFFIVTPTLSQVGVGTIEPESSLDVRAINHLGGVSETDGILVPRVNNLTTDGINDGQLVYLTQTAGTFTKGFHYWNITTDAWTPIDTTIEPWYRAGTTQKATSNSDDIYTSGKVGIGTNNPLGALHITETEGRDALFIRFIDPLLDDFDLDIYRSRGSLASPTLPTTGTRLGGVRYNGLINPSTYGFGPAAEVSSEADGNFTSSSAPGRIMLQTTPVGGLNTLTRVMIKSDGKVGVNTDIPTSTMDINGSVSKSFTSTGSISNFSVTENHYTIRVTNATTAITLPDPSFCEGRVYIIIGANTMGTTIATFTITGGSTIFNDSTGINVTQITQGQRYTIQSTGSNYIVIGE